MTILEKIHAVVWGAPTLVLILGTGILLSIFTGFCQIRLLPRAFSEFFRKLRGPEKSRESMRSFCTALAATVGTGNIAGVAGAIAVGGPGAVFWIWVCGIIGMVIKYAEALLAVHFQTKNGRGERIGGPMYMICRGLGNPWKPLAVIYCAFGVAASFGVGNAAQVNAVTVSVRNTIEKWGLNLGIGLEWTLGIVLGILIGIALLGGAGRIGASAEKLVPLAAAVYLAMCAGVLICCGHNIPAAFRDILAGAVDPKAVTGGMIGSSFRCLQTGISRGIFTNEAGMGTAAIAHGGAQVQHPVQQGLLGIMEVFIDTIVICTLTALVILCSGVAIPYGADPGAELTVEAFSGIYGLWAPGLLSVAIGLFAFAAILGWGLYGGRCIQFLLGDRAWKPFVLCQSLVALVGAVLEVDAVWLVSEIFNGLMVLPNLTAILLLTPQILLLTRDYSAKKQQAEL